MAITIRNKKTEELIRQIGRRTGEGPSALVHRLVQTEASNENSEVSEEEVARRQKLFDDLRKKYPPPNDGVTWAEIVEGMDSIFGDDLK